MSKIFAITHGKRFSGVDPVHTPEGVQQIEDVTVPSNTSFVVTGTGKRHQEMLNILIRKKKISLDTPMDVSPALGSADGLDIIGGKPLIVLTDGTEVDIKGYIGGVTSEFFDVWSFLNSMPDRTLLLTGGELMQALGIKSEKGCLYSIDTETERVEDVTTLENTS